MPAANLSVVLPTYNHAHFLPRALDAILSQSLPAREILIVDDASTDATPRLIDSYARRYPAIRTVRNERNLGVVGAMNHGAGLATGDFLAFSASDDYVLPGFYQKAMGWLDRHPMAGLCFGYDSFQIGEEGSVQPNPGGLSDRAGCFTPDEICQLLRHSIPGHAVIFRRSALSELGWFDSDLAWYCDWFAHLTIAFRYGACHIPEPLAVRVLLPGNYSAGAKPGAKHVGVLRAFLDRMTRSEFADVAPYFRRNGAATFFGPDLVRAAAGRPDCWHPSVLGFLGGLTRDQYQELLADPDPVVRELAGCFLGPIWGPAALDRRAREAEVRELRDELARVQNRVPPSGARRKIRWAAGLVVNRLRHVIGVGGR